MDHLILTRRPDLLILNIEKGTRLIMDFIFSADHKESEKRDKYQDLVKELKNY